ncbi:MAG TPA: FTR1 family protein [Burkholderiales bacterium]|nr:FTR1 family protein [Burkholderiales bacterium]
MSLRRPRLLAVLAAIALLALPARAQDAFQTTLHLLDYVGADYGGAVENGKVRSADEYQEMREFVAQALDRLKALPDHAAKPALVASGAALAKLVEDKAPPEAVADAAAKLRDALARAYDVRLGPRRAPDPARGAKLYAEHCAACHGADGRGDGPAAKGLSPAPANFHDAERMGARSVYGLYSTITLGVTGTSMAPFGQIPEDDRWALAFQAANLGADGARVAAGEQRWKTGDARATFADLASITSLSANEQRKRNSDDAALVQAYLVRHPEALSEVKSAPIAFARESLSRALASYRKGDAAAAREAATVAYLEGFELVEAPLDNVDKALRVEIERDMLALRTAIGRGAPADLLAAEVARVDARLAEAQRRLDSGDLSPSAAFVSALVILLREGLEAILLLAAIIAFVKKTGETAALKYIHAGWIFALALGAATWVTASYVIGISGQNRELTEGVTALIAAAMLLYVGYWLHDKTHAQAWSAFLRENVGRALEKRTVWAMAGVSFLAVYREIFEVVLFYEALWAQTGEQGHGAVWGGIGSAAALLAVAGWGIFRYSIRLPLGPFFTAMSLLLALLAVVFAGQGTAALQEAGVLGASPVPFFSFPILGIHPTLETLAAQLVAAALVVAGTVIGRSQPPATPVGKPAASHPQEE